MKGSESIPLPREQIYTIEDIYHLPDGQRAELIDGQMYDMAPPGRRHQRVLSFLHLAIGNYINSNNGSCEVDIAPFAVFLDEDDYNYVEPDISVICDPGKLTDKGCNGAPDWIIEIVSPGSRRMDYMIKLFKYRSAGVREYWIVDPDKDRIMVYDFAGDETAEYTFSDMVPVGIYPGFSIDFNTIRV
ncbi:MAG: Uma2 family endonuclease [Clostridiales bacterium]|nr:Uma2 family endonuclease [Clostridiales bacterium]